jgi:2-polyprenyl-3-methyl-5-hydroxy-6-metoxy-1,4-benzoquinol methylase
MNKSQHQEKYSHPLKSIFTRFFLTKVVEIVRAEEARTVIDVGCGEGYPDQLLLEAIPALKIVGVDIDDRALGLAKKRNPQVNYLLGDIFNLSFKKRAFDLALVLEVLEHLEYPEKAVEKIKKNARKCLFSVPYEPWFTLACLFSGRYLNTRGRHPDHINSWNTKTFEKMLEKHFKRVNIRICFFWLIALCEDEK